MAKRHPSLSKSWSCPTHRDDGLREELVHVMTGGSVVSRGATLRHPGYAIAAWIESPLRGARFRGLTAARPRGRGRREENSACTRFNQGHPLHLGPERQRRAGGPALASGLVSMRGSLVGLGATPWMRPTGRAPPSRSRRTTDGARACDAGCLQVPLVEEKEKRKSLPRGSSLGHREVPRSHGRRKPRRTEGYA